MEESTKKLETMEENVKEQLKDFDTCYEIHFTTKDISEIVTIMDECFYNGIVAVYKNRAVLARDEIEDILEDDFDELEPYIDFESYGKRYELTPESCFAELSSGIIVRFTD